MPPTTQDRPTATPRALQAPQAPQSPLESLARPARGGIAGLFHYRGSMREMILRVKVHSDHPTLDDLCRVFVGRPEARRAGAWADAVLVCPSSFWGRVRGRLDLAHHLGLSLARAAGKPLLPAAPELYWRIGKRARLKARSRGRCDIEPRNADGFLWLAQLFANRTARWTAAVRSVSRRRPRILIIDDVVTTGTTLRAVTELLPPECRVRALTLAAGPRIPTHPVSLSAFLASCAFDKQEQAKDQEIPDKFPKVLP